MKCIQAHTRTHANRIELGMPDFGVWLQRTHDIRRKCIRQRRYVICYVCVCVSVKCVGGLAIK